MHILGISAFYHDAPRRSSRDGEIVAAAQEERFTRKKHDARFPRHALELLPRARPASRLERRRPRRVLRQAAPQVRAPARDLPRVRAARLRVVPHGDAGVAAGEALPEGPAADELQAAAAGRRWDARLLFTEHHLSHAASAFFPSPFERRPCSRSTASANGRRPSLALGRGNKLEVAAGDPFPALARPALLGVHLLHRVQGELRRVQADGPGAVRRADDTPTDPREPDRPEGRRLVPARP